LPDLTLAEKVVPDRQLLIDAEQQANVFHADAGPLQLDVDFVVYVQVPATGHLTLRWKADDTWWRRITLGDFQKPIYGTVASFIPTSAVTQNRPMRVA
jgi:hypothetical protein